MNWTFWGLLLLVGGTIFTYIGANKSDKHIERLQAEVKNVKDYSYYALLNILGSDRIITGTQFLTVTQHSDLFDRMNKIFTVNGETAFLNNDPSLLPQIDTVIQKYPYFPFGYFAKAELLKAMNSPDWIIPAQKAIEILKITTTIKGHNSAHDDALKALNSMVTQL